MFFLKKQIWSAYKTMAEFNLVLLKEYRKTQGISYPIGINSPEEWIKLIDRFIWAFDQMYVITQIHHIKFLIPVILIAMNIKKNL